MRIAKYQTGAASVAKIGLSEDDAMFFIPANEISLKALNIIANSSIFFGNDNFFCGKGINITPNLKAAYVTDALMNFAHQATRPEAKMGVLDLPV